ncbi:LysR family transcriptional regulator [Acinetobacter pseudolwoffii]|uniref:LysR family transcriptional regulator n=1 Tax=Acinetobacter pseudolwoffii TaxID=2053287 RepID=UPI003FD72B42
MRVNDLKSLIAFMTVVEKGSFIEAAAKLNLTRSTISKMVAKLEIQLGVVLFIRNTRHLALTDEGTIFYEYSQRAVQELLMAEALIENNNDKVQGTIKISVPVLFGQKFIVPISKKISEQYPNLNISLSFNNRCIDLIEENYDLVIRIGELENSGQFIVKKIAEHTMWICATPEYLKNYKILESIEDLEKHQNIGYSKAGQIQSWLMQDNNQIIKYFPNSKVYMDDMQAILNYVLMHGGIAWLPSWLVHPYILNGQLLHLLTQYSGIKHPIQIVWKKSNFLPARTRIVIDQISYLINLEFNK